MQKKYSKNCLKQKKDKKIHITTRQKIFLFGLAGLVLLCIVCWIYFGNYFLKFIEEPQLFYQWMDKWGKYDEIIFIFIRSIQTIIKFIPAEVLEIASGYAWGAVWGMVYCIIGNLMGTIVILVLTKRLGKGLLESFLSEKKKQLLMNLQKSDKIYALLFILYLIPGTPKDGFTYFAGLLEVKIIPFALVTTIARAPSVLVSTIGGSTLAEQQYVLSILIFASSIIVALLGGFFYKKYMSKNT